MYGEEEEQSYKKFAITRTMAKRFLITNNKERIQGLKW